MGRHTGWRLEKQQLLSPLLTPETTWLACLIRSITHKYVCSEPSSTCHAIPCLFNNCVTFNYVTSYLGSN